jgi:predicted nuclease with TOPRIM domain
MARENQDLQIALIVSVMLTIILGVATFLCYRKYTDTEKSYQTALADGSKKSGEADKARDEVSRLKKDFIGVPDTTRVEELSTQFADDMKKYGGAYSQETQFYRPLVEKMFQTIQDKNKELVATKEENQQLTAKYEAREAGKDAQLKEFADQVKGLTQDLKAREETFSKERTQITDLDNNIREQLKTAQKDAATEKTTLEAKVSDSDSQLKKTQEVAKKLRTDNASLTRETMDVPDGEISRINQRNGTLWIDLGKADNLSPLVTFAVYPADVSNLGKGAKKASIEVTQILGDHLAEARILDDKIADPIMPGDKIYTPIWNPGDKRHFALAGFMDINGDGKNNLSLLRNLIKMNGGVVDCDVDEKGKVNGEISVETRYLVLGDKPSEKGDTTGVAAYSKIRGDAENLGIQKISLGDLLERMGYKSQAHLVNFGMGANPNDFKPKPEGGVNHVSSGNVSELFKPREPPRSNTGGAY